MNQSYNGINYQYAMQPTRPIWGGQGGVGMYYYSARYYAPPTFISRDPMFEKYPSISPYTYCANNPMKYVDPTGETIWLGEGENAIEYKQRMKYSGDDLVIAKQVESLNAMNNTRIGEIVLNTLCGSDNKFNITNNASKNGTSEIKENTSGGATLYMNGYNGLSNIAHELFHGYQHENGQGGASIHNEVEAYLFAEGVSMDYNFSIGQCSGDSFSATRYPNTKEGESYSNSISKISGLEFSEHDFNNAINLFQSQSGKNTNGDYNNYPLRKNNQKESLIKNFYPLW